MHRPDFSQLLKVMQGQIPDRPVLYELFLNDSLYRLANGGPPPRGAGGSDHIVYLARAYARLGYDYVSTSASGFGFPAKDRPSKESVSLNDGAVIFDWKTFDEYPWQSPKARDDGRLAGLEGRLPEGMMVKVMGPGGVLENVIGLTGYDNLCYMMYESPDLVHAIFERVGTGLAEYYELAVRHGAVGMICSNDDWGFNTQTFLSPSQMREYVFPWHKRIVEVAHRAGRPIMLHSCGNMRDVIDDIVEDMGYDAKHSYEDNILPVEQAYEAYHGRIAVLGGMDVDFLCTKSPEEVYERSRNMLKRAEGRGGYALGTGNSVPEYIPLAQYGAMLKAALGYDPVEEIRKEG